MSATYRVVAALAPGEAGGARDATAAAAARTAPRHRPRERMGSNSPDNDPAPATGPASRSTPSVEVLAGDVADRVEHVGPGWKPRRHPGVEGAEQADVDGPAGEP